MLDWQMLMTFVDPISDYDVTAPSICQCHPHLSSCSTSNSRSIACSMSKGNCYRMIPNQVPLVIPVESFLLLATNHELIDGLSQCSSEISCQSLSACARQYFVRSRSYVVILLTYRRPPLVRSFHNFIITSRILYISVVPVSLLLCP
jgi:hypothetical protein